MKRRTIIEELNLDLELVQTIYNCQFSKRSEDVLTYPVLPEDGRYLKNFIIKSNEEVLNINQFKIEISELLRSSTSTKFIEKELQALRLKAILVKDYYYEKLTDDSEIVKDFFKKVKELEVIEDNKDRFNNYKKLTSDHSATFYLQEGKRIDWIKFGKDELIKEEYIFNYPSDNEYLIYAVEVLINHLNIILDDENVGVDILLDLSDTNNKEKIIYLHELGVFNFLREKEPFNYSTNKLAQVISALTGIKSTTVQSYINPMVNTSTHQKNNPLKNIESKEKVKNALINIGYKP